jgi:ribonuclease HII
MGKKRLTVTLLAAPPGFERVCGVDEAGRGPLAGAVFAAAVILDPRAHVSGLRDSKALSARARDRLAIAIKERAIAWAVGTASVEEIDRLNILRASLLAMQRAVEALAVTPDLAWIDGKHCPDLRVPSRPIVGGDATVGSIAAASILAKTTRDAYMQQIHAAYPEYGFARHMGYGTAEHLRALAQYGACPAHRVSFAPVRAVLARTGPCA